MYGDDARDLEEEDCCYVPVNGWRKSDPVGSISWPQNRLPTRLETSESAHHKSGFQESDGSSSIRYTRSVVRMMNLIRGASVIGGVALAIATARGAVGGQIVQDSAGIRVVLNSAPTDAITHYQVDSVPLVTIADPGTSPAVGGSTQVRNAKSLSDGRIVVVSGRELVWYNPDGTRLIRVGSDEDGPTHFTEIAALRITNGDTVVALNRKPAKSVVFISDGRHVRSSPLEAMGAVPIQFGHLRDQQWVGLAFGGEAAPSFPGLFREEWFLVRCDLQRAETDTLSVVLGEAYFGDTRGSFRIQASPRAYVSVGAQRIVAASSDTYELKIYDTEGRLIQIIRSLLPNPPPPDPDSIDGDPPTEALWEVGVPIARSDVPVPASSPAFYEVLISEVANVWVRRSSPDVDVAEWHVYDPMGLLTAVVRMPGDLEPTEIAGAYVLGILRDDSGSERVVKYQNPI